MCPACILTIGGGLVIANKLGIESILLIGIVTIIVSQMIEYILRKINNGKPYFPYQKVVIPFLILLISIFIIQFLL